MKGVSSMGKQRRQEILRLLTEGREPITGTQLAKYFAVSRQVIVQDIAILRAQGADIFATSQGYLFGQPHRVTTITKRLACCHSPAQTRAELMAIVTAGCRVIDVIVDHSLYGEIRGLLLLETKADVESFIWRYEKQTAQLLSTLTGGVHLHTIEAVDPGAFVETESKLQDLGFLLVEGD